MSDAWRRLSAEQRVAGVGAVLLVISTFGPFSFVEAAIVLTALGVLALLRERARGQAFHLPGGDGTVLLLAGFWSALLILTRILDRPLGQSVLAFACAALVAAAGLRERTRRRAEHADHDTVRVPRTDDDPTVRRSSHDERTVPFPPADA